MYTAAKKNNDIRPAWLIRQSSMLVYFRKSWLGKTEQKDSTLAQNDAANKWLGETEITYYKDDDKV